MRMGASIKEAAAAIGVSPATYHRWRSKFEGMSASQVRHIRQLESENSRLRRVIDDLEAIGNAVVISLYAAATRFLPSIESLEMVAVTV